MLWAAVSDWLVLGDDSQKYELLTTAVLTLEIWGAVLWDLQGAEDSQWLLNSPQHTPGQFSYHSLLKVGKCALNQSALWTQVTIMTASKQ